MQKSMIFLFAGAALLSITSCGVIEGVFKMGFWSGFLIVVVVIVLIIWLIIRLLKPSR